MKRILFIKLGAIGDVIQAAAAIDEYRRLNTEVQVDWVIGKAIADLLQGMALADRVIAISDQALFSGSLIKRIVAVIKVWIQMLPQMRSYDGIYLAHTSWQYELLTIPAYLRNPQRLLKKIRRFYPRLTEYRVSEYLIFISGVGITSIDGALILQRLGKRLLENSPSAKVDTLLRGAQKKWVALIPGGAKNMARDDFLRRWPVQYYVELSQLLIAQGYGVLLLGGKTDEWVSPLFNGLAVKDLIGQTSLSETVNLIAQVNLLVSHDSGPFHLATLTSTPLVGIFGPTPVSAVAPLGRKYLSIFKADASVICSPCYDGFAYAPCKNPVCMRSTRVDAVFAEITNLLV